MIIKQNIRHNQNKYHRKTFFEQLKCKKVLAEIKSSQISESDLVSPKYKLKNGKQSNNVMTNHKKQYSKQILITKQNVQIINKLEQLNLISNSLKIPQKQEYHINTKLYWKKLDPKISNINNKFKNVFNKNKKSQQYQLPYQRFFYQPSQLVENFITGGYGNVNDICEKRFYDKQNSSIKRFKKIKNKFYTLANIYQLIKKADHFNNLENIRYQEQILVNILHNIQLEEITMGQTRTHTHYSCTSADNKINISKIQQKNKVKGLKKKIAGMSLKKSEKNTKLDSVLLQISNIRQKLLK